MDIPWSPHGIDGRHFDWPGLAAAADLLFIMSYDMQSQVGEPPLPNVAGTPKSSEALLLTATWSL